MNIIQNSSLRFTEGKSDKVYEVDLVELPKSDDSRYLVNFRYGRYGSSLREGSKTSMAVPLDKAQKIYSSLVVSKINKGYVLQSGFNPLEGQAVPTSVPIAGKTVSLPDKAAKLQKRRQETRQNFLKFLGQKGKENYARTSRLIWRLGELKDVEAVPDILKAVAPFTGKTKHHFRNYSIAWALGRIGDGRGRDVLESFLKTNIAPIALNALYHVNGNEGRETLLQDCQSAYLCAELKELLSGEEEPNRLAQNLLAWSVKANGNHENSEKCAEIIQKYLGKQDTNLKAALLKLAKQQGHPASLKAVLSQNDPELLAKDLLAWSGEVRDKSNIRLQVTALYLLAKQDEKLRGALLELARIAPFKFGSIWLIRHLFKIAEFELDADMLSVIIKRIEDSRPLGYDWQNDGYEDTFSFQTRDYLRRRTWRLFRRLGQLEDPAYVALAQSLLLAYKDEDGEEGEWTKYSYDDDWNSISTTFHFHPFASHEAYNQILFRNSEQFVPTPSKTRWHRVSEQADSRRPEAFRALWDEQPHAFLDCLKGSNCQAVQDFGLRALAEKKEYCRTIGARDWADVLKVAYLETASFAKGYIERDHSQALEELGFLHELFVSKTQMAREFIQGWLQKIPSTTLLSDLGWHQDLIVSNYEDNRKASDGYHPLYQGHEDKQQLLLGKLVAWALGLADDGEQIVTLTDEQAGDESYWDGDWERLEKSNAAILERQQEEAAIVLHVSWTILNPLGQQVRSVSFDVLRDFIAHPLGAIQKIGAEILVAQQHKPADIPDDLFASLFESDDPEIRALAVRLLSKLDDEELAGLHALLATLLLSEDAPVREEARVIIKRVAAGNQDFSDKVLEALIPACFRSEKSEGGHDILVACITQDLKQSWPQIDKNLLWRLLQAQSKAAQRVGAAVLMQRPTSDYSVRQWARLGKHAALDVRAWVQKAYADNQAKIRDDFSNGLRLLDTDWDDSRNFALDYFRNRFDAEQWTPDTLILLCDSVRKDVQKLGRDLLRQFFKEEDGESYLLKLSQHPGQNVQLFASEFLQSYAGGKPEIISSLNHYFIAVLSSVNKGRVAKERVLLFLLDEARKSEAIAQQVSEILERQSVTVAILDKGKFIKAMLELQQQYPGLDLPLTKSRPEVRGYQPEMGGNVGGMA